MAGENDIEVARIPQEVDQPVEDNLQEFRMTPPAQATPRGLGFEFPTDPYKHVPEQRQTELNKITDDLISSVVGNDVTRPIFSEFGMQEVTEKDKQITYREYGQLLNEIAQRKDLTEMEKVYVWTHLNAGNGNKYRASTEGANPAVIDSIRSGDTGHCILHSGARDQYHGQMANMTAAEAHERIMENERNEGWKTSPFHGVARKALGVVLGFGDINPGDYQSSANQATALRAMKTQGFAGYAREWNRLFVQS